MRLKLSSSHLDVSFSCNDDNHDHLEILDDIRSLINKLSEHSDVKLSITSKIKEHYRVLPEEDIHPMEG